jgi:hypothetical protein
MRLDLLIRRRQSVEPSAQLIQAAGIRPARELAADVIWIHVAGQQQACLENGFIFHNLNQTLKFHGSILPLMAN